MTFGNISQGSTVLIFVSSTKSANTLTLSQPTGWGPWEREGNQSGTNIQGNIFLQYNVPATTAPTITISKTLSCAIQAQGLEVFGLFRGNPDAITAGATANNNHLPNSGSTGTLDIPTEWFTGMVAENNGTGQTMSWTHPSTAGFTVQNTPNTLYVEYDSLSGQGSTSAVTASGTLGSNSNWACIAQPYIMANNLVNSAITNSTTNTLTLPATATSGNILVCFVAVSGTTSSAPTMTDSASGSWTFNATNAYHTTGNISGYVCYKVAGGSETSVTATATAGSITGVAYAEINGTYLNNGISVDAIQATNNLSTNFFLNDPTTTNANSVVLTAAFTDMAITLYGEMQKETSSVRPFNFGNNASQTALGTPAGFITAGYREPGATLSNSNFIAANFAPGTSSGAHPCGLQIALQPYVAPGGTSHFLTTLGAGT